MSFLYSLVSKRLIPKLVLSLVSLIPCILIHSIPRLVIMLSETLFYLIFGYILSDIILTCSTKLSHRSQCLSLVLMPTFAITLFASQDKMGFTATVKKEKEKFLRIVLTLVSVSFILWVCKKLKVFRNLVETRKMLKRSQHHLGPGLARTFFR